MHRPPPRPRTLNDAFGKLDALDRAYLELKEDLGSLAAELASVRAGPALTSPPLAPYRDPEGSYHDFDEDVKQFRRALKRHDSVRARQIAKEAVKSAERENKAAHWDKLVQNAWRILVGVLIGVLVTAIIYRFGIR
jgi:hypothetical protein